MRHKTQEISAKIKLLLTTILLFILSLPNYSQELLNLRDNSTVSCIAYWSKGDKLTYHVVEQKEQFKNDNEKPSKTVKEEYDVILTVIDSADSTYVIDMTFSKFVNNNDKFSTHSELKKIFDKIHLKYKVNDLGEFIEIINKVELSTAMSGLIDKLVPEITTTLKKAEQKAEVENVFNNLKALISDPENIDGLFGDKIYYIHSFYGIGLKLNKEEVFEMAYPSIANIELKGTGTLMLTEINKAGNECKIQMSQQPDKEELKTYTNKIITALMGDLIEDKKIDAAKFSFTSNTKLKYVMELSTGFFKKITSTSTTSVNTGKDKIRSVSKIQFSLQ